MIFKPLSAKASISAISSYEDSFNLKDYCRNQWIKKSESSCGLLSFFPLDSKFVEQFSELYNTNEISDTEVILFDEVSPKLQSRGKYELEEFFAVCDWKTTRTRTLVHRNRREHVSEVTHVAFNCSEWLQVPVLSALSGVGTPTASALLTVWRPNSYTIIDFRVLNALSKLSHHLIDQESLAGLDKSYTKYLALMRSLSRSVGCDLRSLDKALWTFDKTDTKP